ncbi:hypothetical protein T08_1472, partial [Trichinella sp. T8]
EQKSTTTTSVGGVKIVFFSATTTKFQLLQSTPNEQCGELYATTVGKYVSTCRSVRLIDYYGIYWAAAAESSVSVNGATVVAAAIRGKSKSTLRRMDRPERCRISTSCESFFSFDNTAAGCRFLADQVENEKKKQWKLEEQKDDDDTETLPRDDDDHQYYCSASPQSADGGCANCRLLRDKLVKTKRLLAEIDSTVRRLAEQHRVRADELTDARQRLRLAEQRRRLVEQKLEQPSALLAKENVDLRGQLAETRAYFERLDLESDQRIADMTNLLEQFQDALADKERQLFVAYAQLDHNRKQVEQYAAKIRHADAHAATQQDIIEGLQNQLDKQKAKSRACSKHRDDLLLKSASLSHELVWFKRETMREREYIRQQIEQLRRHVGQQRQLTTADDHQQLDANMLITLRDKIREVEEAIDEREMASRMLQLRLDDLKLGSEQQQQLSQLNYRHSFDQGSNVASGPATRSNRLYKSVRLK